MACFQKQNKKKRNKKNGSEYKHRRRLWFLPPPVRRPNTIPFLSPFPSLSLSPYNPLPFPSQFPPCPNPLPSTTQYNLVPSMEHPGTYYVRIRGGPSSRSMDPTGCRVLWSRRLGGATPASWPGDTQLRVRAAVCPKQAVMLLGLLVLQGPLETPLVGITRAVISPLRQGTREGLKRLKWPPAKGETSSARRRHARGAPAGTRCASMDIKTFL